MSIQSIRPSQSDQLLAYPLLVTGQFVSMPSQPPRQSTVRNTGSGRVIGRRPSARLHHTSRFGAR